MEHISTIILLVILFNCTVILVRNIRTNKPPFKDLTPVFFNFVAVFIEFFVFILPPLISPVYRFISIFWKVYFRGVYKNLTQKQVNGIEYNQRDSKVANFWWKRIKKKYGYKPTKIKK